MVDCGVDTGLVVAFWGCGGVKLQCVMGGAMCVEF